MGGGGLEAPLPVSPCRARLWAALSLLAPGPAPEWQERTGCALAGCRLCGLGRGGVSDASHVTLVFCVLSLERNHIYSRMCLPKMCSRFQTNN